MPESMLRLVESTESMLDHYIDEFLAAKGSRETTTVKFYELPLRQYRQHVGPHAWPPTDSSINNYLAACKRRRLKQNTIFAYYRALKTWCNWLYRHGAISFNPIELVEKHKPVYRLPRAPGIKTIQALFGAIRANPEQWRKKRDIALFHLLLDTGLRVGETASILVSEVDLERREIYIPETKTHEQRFVVFSDMAAQALESWLKIRAGLPGSRLKNLFISYAYKTNTWGRFTTDGMREAKNRYFARIRLSAFRLHDLRHAYAIYTIRNGGNLLDIQNQLGHKDIKTTSIYLRADNEERSKRHQKSSPLNSL